MNFDMPREERKGVWRTVDKDEHGYVPRCSWCGYFKKELKTHWFFTGLYCVRCIQAVLYDNCRTVDEIENKKPYVNPNGAFNGELR